ncbi:hypothetical protein D6D27_04089 [Aureobasidium pullulans]|nr:hypothetical protein D6D27_04089 [Aureobasidium pullulans]
MAHPKVGFNDTSSDIRFLVHEYMCRDRKKSMTADRDSYMESSTGSDSTIDSESEPVPASPALQENPFKTAFATPQSSVVNVVLRRAAQQARATKFVECDCVHYFFATTSTARTGEASRTLDSGIEDLIAHIDDMDSTDPTTASVVYLTTVGTWAHGSLKDKGLARQSDAVLHQA